jgi:hypothetical protein
MDHWEKKMATEAMLALEAQQCGGRFLTLHGTKTSMGERRTSLKGLQNNRYVPSPRGGV